MENAVSGILQIRENNKNWENYLWALLLKL